MGSMIRRRAAGAAVLALVAGIPFAPTGQASHESGCAVADHPGGDWPLYGHDLANTRNQPAETYISPGNVGSLSPVWTLSTNDATGGQGGDITGTPIVVDGCLYVGTNEGWVIAANADTGERIWAAQVPRSGAINSTVAVGSGLVVASISQPTVGGCAAGADTACAGPYAAAFDQHTGELRWATPALDTQSGADAYASPVLYRGYAAVGISGGAASLAPDETVRLDFQGSINFIRLSTGEVAHKTWTIPPSQHYDNATGTGYSGAGVWGTMAVDPSSGFGYVGTSNPYSPDAEHAHANAILKLDLRPGSATRFRIVGSYKGLHDTYVSMEDAPCFDTPGNLPPYYPQGLGSCGDLDLDFGASPNLWHQDGRLMVGAGQKAGVYHAVDTADLSRPVWRSIVGPPSLVGGVVGSTAVAGGRVVGPVTPGGYLWALDSSSGSLRWVSPTLDAAHYGNPVAVANGVAYTLDFKGFIDAYGLSSGLPLLHRPMVLGADTGTDIALSWGGLSIARSKVYATVGITGLPDGFVIAYAPLPGAGRLPAIPDPASLLPSTPEPGQGDDPGDDDPGDHDPGGGGGGGPALTTIIAAPGAALTTYATPIVVLPRGTRLRFTNLDVVAHDVESRTRAWPENPLIGIGQSSIVDTSGLGSGQYEFFCSIHSNMTGTLVVT